MKKLIKPGKPIEEYSDDTVQAFCEYDGCTSNCRTACTRVQGCMEHCTGVSAVTIDDDILY